jgi:hypothetical protein
MLGLLLMLSSVAILIYLFHEYIMPIGKVWRSISNYRRIKKNSHTNAISARSNMSVEKGVEFEKFIVSKFSKQHFKLLRWRSDKYINGIYASENKDPDLVFEYRSQTGSFRFAVECKWRSGFFEGNIQLAKPYQILNYHEFIFREKIPVFIALGIGGYSWKPADVYLFQLKSLPAGQIHLDEQFLMRFKRAMPNSNIYFDARSGNLY